MDIKKICPEVSNYAHFLIWGIQNAHLATMIFTYFVPKICKNTYMIKNLYR